MTVRTLAWEARAESARVRCARFVEEPPFDLRLLAACANDIAERLQTLLAASISVGMLPPVVLTNDAWERLREGGRAYDVRGDGCDATILLDEAAVSRIAACAFGERSEERREPSAIEARIVDRVAEAVAAGIQPACAEQRNFRLPLEQRRVACELRLGVPLGAAIGIVFHEHAREPAPTLGPTVLEDCAIECWVRLGTADVDIFTVAGFAVGDLVRLEAKVGAFATLNLGAEPIAAGEGGVLGDRTAFKVHELI